jgi:SulP family sulfate permease
VIMAAVGNLINFKAIRHAWAAQRHDGIAAIVAFVATLGFAPHLDTGILVGGALAIVLYLYRTMRPRIAVLSRHPDGTLRDARLHGLPTSPHIIVIRFDGSLYFANVPYFEDTVLQEAAQSHKAKFILIVADGINEIDGSGVEAIRHMVGRLKDAGITMLFSGVKNQVLQVMDTTGLHSLIGVQNFFRTEEAALDAIYRRIDDPSFDPSACPLSPPKGDTQPASQQASHGT